MGNPKDKGNPKDNIKNPTITGLLSFFCFILGFINMMRISNEINEYKLGGETVPNGFLTIIPFYNILVTYKLFSGMKEFQAENGIPEEEQINPVASVLLCCVLGVGIMQAQAGLNKVWEKM